MEKKILIKQDVGLIGHLRYGHYELALTEKEYKEFKSMSKEEQKDWIKDGNFSLDSYSIDYSEFDGDYTVKELANE